MVAYLQGFGNHHASEALEGALPEGRNSPQQPALGLYAEKISATPFTLPRARNQRAWLYRRSPSVTQLGFTDMAHAYWCTAPLPTRAPPDPLRWAPLEAAVADADFIDGVITLAASGDAALQRGCGVHMYHAYRDMQDRYFYCADGELMLVPQQGALALHTEFGVLDVKPGHVAVLPRGVKFSVRLLDGTGIGYLCENYGAPFVLPELGPLGSDGLANARDFEYPVAACETRDTPAELVCKTDGRFYSTQLADTPLNVVAWHGNLAPYRYDLHRFNAMGTVSYDHPDPSINTVLSAPTAEPGCANVDFVVFGPRWQVAEDTFRPPWYHRNVMSEFMGLIYGEYDGKRGGGFLPGGASLHNCMVPHGPDAQTHRRASQADLTPDYIEGALAFMFESRLLLRPSEFALASPGLQADYIDCWSSTDPSS